MCVCVCVCDVCVCGGGGALGGRWREERREEGERIQY